MHTQCGTAHAKHRIHARLRSSRWIASSEIDVKSKEFIRAHYIDYLLDDESNEVSYEEQDSLPVQIIPNDDEAFCAADGEELNIRVMGYPKTNERFFNVSDVAMAFGSKPLLAHITKKHSSYERDIHYRIFDICASDINRADAQEDAYYLTYRGLLKAIFSSRSANAEPFVIWATKTLFTAHLGTPESKQLLASSLTGISLDGIKNLCSATSGIIACIYLIRLARSLSCARACRSLPSIPTLRSCTSSVAKQPAGFAGLVAPTTLESA